MRWGAWRGALERALSPSSVSDHLGNSRFKPDLQCLDRPREPASPNPEAEKAVRTTEGF